MKSNCTSSSLCSLTNCSSDHHLWSTFSVIKQSTLCEVQDMPVKSSLIIIPLDVNGSMLFHGISRNFVFSIDMKSVRVSIIWNSNDSNVQKKKKKKNFKLKGRKKKN